MHQSMLQKLVEPLLYQMLPAHQVQAPGVIWNSNIHISKIVAREGGSQLNFIRRCRGLSWLLVGDPGLLLKSGEKRVIGP